MRSDEFREFNESSSPFGDNFTARLDMKNCRGFASDDMNLKFEKWKILENKLMTTKQLHTQKNV